jgi:hypothetical protein
MNADLSEAHRELNFLFLISDHPRKPAAKFTTFGIPRRLGGYK